LGPDVFAGTALVPATELVATTATLSLGGRDLTLTAHKTAHTDNDLTVRDALTGTIFMGDLLFSEHVPTLDGSIRGWQQVLAVLGQEPAARVVPGHGPTSMSWPAAMADQQRYLAAITADVRALIKQGKTLNDATATAARSEQAAWLLFDEFHQRNVSAAFAELEWE
jgi:glyoxylase-like metal-dependent hydrolase (beta-lactamase superfamily II)